MKYYKIISFVCFRGSPLSIQIVFFFQIESSFLNCECWCFLNLTNIIKINLEMSNLGSTICKYLLINSFKFRLA